jgi:hypothetical protein
MGNHPDGALTALVQDAEGKFHLIDANGVVSAAPPLLAGKGPFEVWFDEAGRPLVRYNEGGLPWSFVRANGQAFPAR